MQATVNGICQRYNRDPHRLMDILWDLQHTFNYLSPKALELSAEVLGVSVCELRSVASFYTFFHLDPVGKYIIHLDTSWVAQISGREEIKEAFENACNCKFGETDPENLFSLFDIPCIGMSDQSPAALINGFTFPSLTPKKVSSIVASLKANKAPQELCKDYPVEDNIRKKGDFFFQKNEVGKAFEIATNHDPHYILDKVKESGLRGRGGAGFPTGIKWETVFSEKAETKYVVCNADEGEPGTFKDRVLLSKSFDLVCEGMAICAHAISAKECLIYLRAEYRYLLEKLESQLSKFSKDFSIPFRIQLGAGAYICGEESSLLESLEGRRGISRIRPPLPAHKGYMGKPTVINNVETFACIPSIFLKGAEHFHSFGKERSSGTKLLSVSGDCTHPGIYEEEWGLSVAELCERVGAKDVQGVMIGGPSGIIISKDELHREISFEDLATGGSIIIFGSQRNLLEAIDNFMDFFAEESCGACVPCRAGVISLSNAIKRILSGRGTEKTFKEIHQVSNLMQATSRCGLGKTAPNPILTTLKAFPDLYESLLRKDLEKGCEPFDLKLATQAFRDATSGKE